MFKTHFQIDFFNKWKLSLIKLHDLLDTLYYITLLECNTTYIHTHIHINISQYYQHSKKIDNIDKTVPVSFSSSCCLDKLIFKKAFYSVCLPK